ncbi:TPA: polysaccharide pyruvyl transferase family protein [Vibrio parahaemolyticus]|uniref:polysaccharide pyruvyl transferase family protein n=1 Tax=Vibrio parahaemolyticus TaxID=670 RepID=UPI001120DDBE|nr:polysaccharide pyruvyl transferase family protein [Vibrio parahaemolyticus]MBD2856866.1 polysaccharide pyruvyl transferase family protein [Vibrio parahaemolyticus]MBW6448597.1 polysaccharide pyruvyl transferase family protein [Vibrio parahaemolyticus]TPA38675.1 polysaccharide pyruvyl transferase family protein [Vibrio parahaemolyticus]HAS3128196.1 polysaccharide pyruvyl transferase family protein [Vibrio parahaemolyticus]HAS3131866.1 polysaccharide pyruvyl transferase family protein [Vibrio
MTAKKLVMVGYTHDTNLGDQVIADSAEYLIKKNIIDSEFSVERFNLNYSNEFNRFKRIKRKVINKILIRLSSSSSFDYKVGCYKRDYKNKFNDASAIVFAGGGMIKFKYQDCWAHISALVDTVANKPCPIFFNAVGVEGYDQSNYKCRLLKESLNHSAIKMVTTRDDLSLLNDGYIENGDIKTAQVADSAVFSSEVYGIQKKSRDVVGLGLVRARIFKDNGIDLDRTQVIDLYASLISELEARGQSYQLFTNGLKSDVDILEDLETYLGKQLNVIEPQTPRELVELISTFKCTIAARLHACIISYSLTVPAVGLVWNNKVKMFGECIGYPERFFSHQDFDANEIIDRLTLSVAEGYEPNHYERYRETVNTSINKMISMI